MADVDKDQKTHAPSAYRLKQARKKGQIAKSRELPTAALIIAVTFFFHYYSPTMIKGLSRIMRELLSLSKYEINPQSVIKLLFFCVTEAGLVVAPYFIMIAIVAYAINLYQVGFMFTTKTLKLNFGVLNPISGFGKFFNKRSLVELGKSLFKVFAIGAMAYSVVAGEMSTIATLPDAELPAIFTYLGNLLYEIMWKIALLALILAIIDYKYQNYQYMEDMKMTKEEVKDEHKMMEGDPKIKNKIRQKQREIARRRMMEQVPEADVVVTNPTHYAVALKYTPGVDRAPICLAKGQRLIALRIREIAQQNGVLVHEAPPLARSLFKTVDIGDEIPENLYKAVAEVLSLVEKFRRSA